LRDDHAEPASVREGSGGPGGLEAIQRPFSQLERYAGWLARDHVSVAVRADVQALGAAIHVGHDTSLELLKLDQDIGRMPSGDIRKMLRKAMKEIRVVLAVGDAARAGETS
jgi:hypothetical protein